MSSPFYNSQNPFDVKPAIHSVMQDLEALASLINGRMRDEGDLSTHDVANRSGGLISHGTVWNIINKKVGAVSDKTLRGLARGTNTAEDIVFSTARGKQEKHNSELDEVYVLFHGWQDAAPQVRAITMEAIRLLAEGFQHRRKMRPPENGGNNPGHKPKHRGQPANKLIGTYESSTHVKGRKGRRGQKAVEKVANSRK